MHARKTKSYLGTTSALQYCIKYMEMHLTSKRTSYIDSFNHEPVYIAYFIYELVTPCPPTSSPPRSPPPTIPPTKPCPSIIPIVASSIAAVTFFANAIATAPIAATAVAI